MAPRETENNAYAKFWGDKQRALRYVVVFSGVANRPFQSCAKPLFQGEAKGKVIDMKTIFYSHADKTHFHKKSFALRLVLKVREFGTRKWLNNKIRLRGLAALFPLLFLIY